VGRLDIGEGLFVRQTLGSRVLGVTVRRRLAGSRHTPVALSPRRSDPARSIFGCRSDEILQPLLDREQLPQFRVFRLLDPVFGHKPLYAASGNGCHFSAALGDLPSPDAPGTIVVKDIEGSNSGDIPMMIRICVVAATLGLFVTGVSAQSLDKVEHGKKVYAAQKCQVCHSIHGVGNQKGALDDVGARLSDDEIRSWIISAPEMTAKTKAARKPMMKSYKLEKADLDALVAYMESLKAKKS
jgi:mono/diheme cytochrome c family protein